MKMALKIWRFDSGLGRACAQGVRGRRAGLGDAPRPPRHRQGPPRRDARLPQELPDDDLRLLRDADGRRGGARVQDADGRHRGVGPRPGDLRDGEHADRQGPRRRHGPVLGEDPRRPAVAPARLLRARREGVRRLAGGHGRHPQGVALHHVRLLRVRVQLDGGGPRVPRACRAREGHALRRRRARPGDGRAPPVVLGGARHLGLHALLLLPASAARRASTRATRSRSSAPRR